MPLGLRGGLLRLFVCASASQLTSRARESRYEQREAFKTLVAHVPLDRLWFIDESHVVSETTLLRR